MNIYGTILSPFVARVVMAARHKGLKHKMIMPEGGLKTPAFLKMNPMGKMPVIKDGATTLFESAVILDYLDAKYKKKRIIPTAAKAAAQSRLICAIMSEYVQPAVFGLFGQRDPATRNAAVVEAKLAEINRALGALEALAAAKPHIAGPKLTIADCYAVPAMFFLHTITPEFGVANPLAAHKKLGRYMAKVRKDKLMNGIYADMDTALKNWRPGQN